MNDTPTLLLISILFHLVPHITSIEYISKTSLLSDVTTKYQLASFTNIRIKSRYLDLVFLDNNHEKVTVKSLDTTNDTYHSPPKYQYSFHGEPIISGFKIIGILPADFNNDQTTDLMVVFASEDGPSYKLAILWNRDESFNSPDSPPTYINETFSDVPHLLDYDGDLHVDFICAQENNRYFWINDKDNLGTFNKQPISSNDKVDNVEIDVSKGENLYIYGDLNGDCAADLFMITKLKNGSSVFQIYEAKGKELVKSDFIIPSFPAAQFGAPLLEDIDGNGKLDIIIPCCTKVVGNICDESKILIYYNDPCNAKSSDKCTVYKNSCDKYTLEFERFVFDKFEHEKEPYGFLRFDRTQDLYGSRYMLRAADYDSDGHVDLFAILKNKYDNTQRAVIFQNKPDINPDVGGRSFELNWRDDLNLSTDQTETYQPYAITAVDALGKGSIQFFVLGRNKAKDHEEDFSLTFLAPKDNLDSFWLKVTILCYKCDNSSTTVIGANVAYYTTGYKGNDEVAYGSQSSQLAPFSLQAPYMLFGLGQQANYIEYIKVAYRNTVRPRSGSRSTETDTVDMFKFDQLIPNAQVFAIPLESMWRLVMMIVPGKTMWQTLLVLGICCIVCIVIILILHIKEKKEDEREKRKFNAKFNFDAM